MNNKKPTLKFCPECGTRVKGEFCEGCGKQFKVMSRRVEKRTHKKAPAIHSLDPREWWILPALIVTGVIGYGMYMDGMLWLFGVCVFAVIGLRVITGGGKKKSR